MNTDSKLHTTFTGFLNSLTARNTTRYTRIAYQTDLRQFFIWLLENNVTVSVPIHISRGHIIKYLAFLAQQGRSGATRARKLAAIREHFKYLVAEELLPASPASTIAMHAFFGELPRGVMSPFSFIGPADDFYNVYISKWLLARDRAVAHRSPVSDQSN